MQDAFKILADFLEHFDDEVQGHALEEPPAEVRTRIQSFARGTLEERHKAELVQSLNEHPEWISILAQEVKSMRSNPSSSS